MAKTLLFIVNPRAGRTRSMGPLFEAVAHFGQEGYLVSVRQTTHPGHAAELAEAEGARYDRIVCCGGDGTLNETVSGLMRLPDPPPLGYIPGGSTNDFAASLERRPPGASPPARAAPWTWDPSTAGPLSTWPPSGPLPGPPTARPSPSRTIWDTWPTCWRG